MNLIKHFQTANIVTTVCNSYCNIISCYIFHSVYKTVHTDKKRKLIQTPFETTRSMIGGASTRSSSRTHLSTAKSESRSMARETIPEAASVTELISVDISHVTQSSGEENDTDHAKGKLEVKRSRRNKNLTLSDPSEQNVPAKSKSQSIARKTTAEAASVAEQISVGKTQSFGKEGDIDRGKEKLQVKHSMRNKTLTSSHPSEQTAPVKSKSRSITRKSMPAAASVTGHISVDIHATQNFGEEDDNDREREERNVKRSKKNKTLTSSDPSEQNVPGARPKSPASDTTGSVRSRQASLSGFRVPPPLSELQTPNIHQVVSYIIYVQGLCIF